MKISSFDPKSACTAPAIDDSRLGSHALPALRDELSALAHGIVLLGAADDTGVRNVGGRTGAAEGPRAVRSRLYRFTTGKPRVPFYDLGDLLPAASLEDTHAALATCVRELLEAGHFPIVIGGGHDLGFPQALGMLQQRQRKLCVLSIDAHLDVRPAKECITSGSPWYLLAEHELFRSCGGRVEEFGIQPHCNAKALVRYAEEKGFGLHWLSQIRRSRRSVAEQLAKLLPRKDRALVSFDIDSVQFADAPGCSAPQTEGFLPGEALAICRLAGAHPRVESFGLFELSPPLDPDGRTALLAAHCINAVREAFESRSQVKRSRK